MRRVTRRTAGAVATAVGFVLTISSAEELPVRESPAGEEEAEGEVGGLFGIFFPKPDERAEPVDSEVEEPALAEGDGELESGEPAAEPAPEAPVAAPEGDRPADHEAPAEDVAREAEEAPDAAGQDRVPTDPPASEEAASRPPEPAVDAAGSGDEPAAAEAIPPALAAPPTPVATPAVPVLGLEPEDSAPAADVAVEPEPEDRPALATEPSPAPVEEQGPAPREEEDEIVVRPAPSPTPDLDADLRASRRPAPEPPGDPDALHLPTEEIYGEIEKPDIFFLLPKARSKSDEQLIRSRIQREITRPLIKDWLEEELLLK